MRRLTTNLFAIARRRSSASAFTARAAGRLTRARIRHEHLQDAPRRIAKLLAAVSIATVAVVATIGTSFVLTSYADAAQSKAESSSQDPLLAAELAVLTQKGISSERAKQTLDLQSSVAQADLIDKMEAAMGSEYGGAWFDPSVARLRIGATSPTGRRIAETTAAEAGLSADVAVTPVRSTQAELAAAQENWDGKLADLLAIGEAKTAIQPQRNAVLVTIGSSLPSTRRAALQKEASSARVSIVVSVVPRTQLTAVPTANNTACVKFSSKNANCNASLTSGVGIGSTKSFCTAGPLAIPIASKKDTTMLTAGHCGSTGEPLYAFTKTGVEHKIGTVKTSVYGINGDYGEIPIEPSSFWLLPGSDPVFAGTAQWLANEERSWPVQGESTPTALAVTCHDGQISGGSCGQITSTSVSVGFLVDEGATRTVTVKSLVEAQGTSLKVEKGDSGGPFFFEDSAAKEVRMEGILSGFLKDAATTFAYYQALKPVLDSLKLELLTTTSEYRADGFLWTGSLPGLVLVLSQNLQTFATEPEGPRIICKTFKGHGILSKGAAMTAKEMTVTGNYTGCEALGAKAEASSAEILLNSDGSLAVAKSIVITVPTAACSIKISNEGANGNLKTIKYLNLPQEILAHVELVKVTSLASGGLCGTAGEEKPNGSYNGLLLLLVHGGVIKWG